MWIRYVFLALFGVSAGGTIACGYFALISSVGTINRLVHYTHTGSRVRLYEDVIILGVILGNLLWLFEPILNLPLVLWTVFALMSGVFTGCFLVSLAEAVKGLPIFARRARLKNGIKWIIIALALGKGIGSLLYFLDLLVK